MIQNSVISNNERVFFSKSQLMVMSTMINFKFLLRKSNYTTKVKLARDYKYKGKTG